ncbi:hypothetical protein GUJ93_ZPchr0006g43562 [Zizania palustris]|uniref:Uncharacterized protein n=1 Tax=Zizania palustris TaxID=103762 RepID=A0A8J5SS97_ZIZPA|nr:hypothetical protein GUJ93_ZPchr0006g43562 [Zizania palustris]
MKEQCCPCQTDHIGLKVLDLKFALLCKKGQQAGLRKRDEVAGDGGASTSAAPAGPPQQKKRTPQKKLASKKKRPLAAGGELAVRSLRSWLDL